MTGRKPIHAVAPDSRATARPALVPDDQEDALTALALLLNREEFAADVVRDSDNHKLVQTIRNHVTSITREITSRTSRLREGREAHEIQRGLFPARLPSPPSFEIHGSWHPAAEVGGDYYDAIELDDSSTRCALRMSAGREYRPPC